MTCEINDESAKSFPERFPSRRRRKRVANDKV